MQPGSINLVAQTPERLRALIEGAELSSVASASESLMASEIFLWDPKSRRISSRD